MDLHSLTTRGLPAEIQPLFQKRGIQALNNLQVAALEAGLLDGQSILVSAPTSSGKTLVGELTALRYGGQGLSAYLVSHKALAREVFSIFRTWYISEGVPLIRTGLVTGDEDTVKGEWHDIDLIVSTYEKFYSLIVGHPSVLRRLRAVVVDEVQMVGDRTRGPGLELLLARLLWHQDQHPLQLIALSATIPNSHALADWLRATCVHLDRREPPLEHEIWLPGQCLRFAPEREEPERYSHEADVESVGEVVEYLLREGRGPVVVMATTKPDARRFAREIGEAVPIDDDFPVEIIDEFRAMGEGTEVTNEICGLLPRRVGVHHADLAPEQLRVVETAFRERRLSVLVATTTLVAGVNLPIRTVLYPKMTRWAGHGDELIEVREYLNGSGRAGRQGYFDIGTSIICAPSLAAAHNFSRRYVLSPPGPVESQLEGRSTDFLAMHLLAALPGSTARRLARAATRTLWGSQRGYFGDDARAEHLEAEFAGCLSSAAMSTCWTVRDGKAALTRAGRAIVSSGLEPSLALESFEEVRRYHDRCAAGRNRKEVQHGLICRLCLTEGVDDYLPYMSRFRSDWASELEPELGPRFGSRNLVGLARNIVGAGHAFLAVGDFVGPEDVRERMSGFRGERNRITGYLARLLRAGCAVADAENARMYEETVGHLSLLADQLHFQVAADAVALTKLFASYRVRNLGPKKIARLAKVTAGEISRVLKLTNDQLHSAVGEKQVPGVRKAALLYLRGLTKEQSSRQLAEASGLEDYEGVIADLLGRQGKSFEPAVHEALSRLGWTLELVSSTTSGKKPDLTGTLPSGDRVWIECKTAEDLGGEISRKEALDVVGKPIPEGVRSVFTVGRPVFSSPAILGCLDRKDKPLQLRLVTAGALIELLLGVARDEISREDATGVLCGFRHIDVSRVRSEMAQ